MAEQQSTGLVLLEDLNRAQLEEVANAQQSQITVLRNENVALKEEKPLPFPVEMGIGASAAYGASRADAAAGADGKIEAVMATAASAGALGLRKVSPQAAKALRETAKGITAGMAAKAGARAGMADAAEREARRLQEQQANGGAKA